MNSHLMCELIRSYVSQSAYMWVNQLTHDSISSYVSQSAHVCVNELMCESINSCVSQSTRAWVNQLLCESSSSCVSQSGVWLYADWLALGATSLCFVSVVLALSRSSGWECSVIYITLQWHRICADQTNIDSSSLPNLQLLYCPPKTEPLPLSEHGADLDTF